MIGECIMRNKLGRKKQSIRYGYCNRLKANSREALRVRVTKQLGKTEFQIISSPDSEIMAKYIEKFDYVPERKFEVLKKYEQMVMPAYEHK